MGFFSTLLEKFGKPAQTQAPAEGVAASPAPAGGMDQFQMMMQVLQPALVKIIDSVVQDPQSDTLAGRLRFNDAMQATEESTFFLNNAPIEVSPAVLGEANRILAPLNTLPQDQRYRSLKFNFDKGALEMNMDYDS